MTLTVETLVRWFTRRLVFKIAWGPALMALLMVGSTVAFFDLTQLQNADTRAAELAGRQGLRLQQMSSQAWLASSACRKRVGRIATSWARAWLRPV